MTKRDALVWFHRHVVGVMAFVLFLGGRATAGAICFCVWRYEMRLIDGTEGGS